MGIVTTSQVVQIIVGIMVAVVIPYIGYHLAGWLAEGESHIHDVRVRGIVNTFVSAAEQTLVDSSDKYNFVYKLAAQYIPEVNHDELNSLIEASVLAMKVAIATNNPSLNVHFPPAPPPSTEPTPL